MEISGTTYFYNLAQKIINEKKWKLASFRCNYRSLFNVQVYCVSLLLHSIYIKNLFYKYLYRRIIYLLKL